MDKIDYRNLLKKYISHVMGSEGADFIDYIRNDGTGGYGGIKFSDQEIEELKMIADEGLREYNV